MMCIALLRSSPSSVPLYEPTPACPDVREGLHRRVDGVHGGVLSFTAPHAVCARFDPRQRVPMSGKGYIDASTVSTAACKEIAEEVHRTGARFLEAPVSGSKQPAEQGTLIFLAAGARPLAL